MIRSDYDTSTINNKSVSSRLSKNTSQVQLLSDLKKTTLQKVIENKLIIFDYNEQQSQKKSKKQIANYLFSNVQKKLKFNATKEDIRNEVEEEHTALKHNASAKPITDLRSSNARTHKTSKTD